MPLLTTFWIRDITFEPGLDILDLPASPNRRTTASFIRAGILQIFLRNLFSNLTDEAGFVGKVLKVSSSSDTGRSAMTLNMSSSCVLRRGVATSCSVACKDWSAIGGFMTIFSAPDAVVI